MIASSVARLSRDDVVEIMAITSRAVVRILVDVYMMG